MKNLLYGTLFLALVGIAFVGCEKSDNDTNDTKRVRANDSQKQELIQSISELKSFRGKRLYSEQEYQTDFYRILMLNFKSESSSSSALVILHLDDNYVTLMDKQSIRFVKGSINIRGEVKSPDEGDISYQINGKSVYVCDESCCQWSQLSNTHFRCDCPSAVVGPELSTGSGCVIKVETARVR